MNPLYGLQQGRAYEKIQTRQLNRISRSQVNNKLLQDHLNINLELKIILIAICSSNSIIKNNMRLDKRHDFFTKSKKYLLQSGVRLLFQLCLIKFIDYSILLIYFNYFFLFD